MRVTTRRSRSHEPARWVVSAKPRTTGLLASARSVRTASQTSSSFLASGFLPDSPKM
jgi:hypothetical protein